MQIQDIIISAGISFIGKEKLFVDIYRGVYTKPSLSFMAKKLKRKNQTQNDFLWHWMAHTLNRSETLVYKIHDITHILKRNGGTWFVIMTYMNDNNTKSTIFSVTFGLDGCACVCILITSMCVQNSKHGCNGCYSCCGVHAFSFICLMLTVIDIDECMPLAVRVRG